MDAIILALKTSSLTAMALMFHDGRVHDAMADGGVSINQGMNASKLQPTAFGICVPKLTHSDMHYIQAQLAVQRNMMQQLVAVCRTSVASTSAW